MWREIYTISVSPFLAYFSLSDSGIAGGFVGAHGKIREWATKTCSLHPFARKDGETTKTRPILSFSLLCHSRSLRSRDNETASYTGCLTRLLLALARLFLNARFHCEWSCYSGGEPQVRALARVVFLTLYSQSTSLLPPRRINGHRRTNVTKFCGELRGKLALDEHSTQGEYIYSNTPSRLHATEIGISSGSVGHFAADLTCFTVSSQSEGLEQARTLLFYILIYNSSAKKELRHGWRTLDNLAYVCRQVPRLQSVSIFPNFNHPCSILFYYNPFGVFLCL